MTLYEAIEILSDAIKIGGTGLGDLDGEYIYLQDSKQTYITLDGSFTQNELEAIVTYWKGV